MYTEKKPHQKSYLSPHENKKWKFERDYYERNETWRRNEKRMSVDISFRNKKHKIDIVTNTLEHNSTTWPQVITKHNKYE